MTAPHTQPPLATLAARHLLAQRRVVAALAGVVGDSLRRDIGRSRRRLPELPGPELCEDVPPPSERLIDDYLRQLGGDARSYASTIPAHLFPHWGMPLAARVTRGLPYRLLSAVNGGCRLAQHAPLVRGQPLAVRAQLVGVRDDGRRAVLQQRIVTARAGQPAALTAEVYVIVPSANAGGRRAARIRQPDERPRVSPGARELCRFDLSANAGLAYALLTGDLNPVHWLRPYARAAGFEGTILHGFASMALCIEALQRTLFDGAADGWSEVDVRFTRPLCLPAEVGLYLDGEEFFVGRAAGELAHLTGHFRRRER